MSELRSLCPCALPAAALAAPERWKQCERPSAAEWVSKAWRTQCGCYSVLKRREILTQAAVWVDLENIVLCEISQS